MRMSKRMRERFRERLLKDPPRNAKYYQWQFIRLNEEYVKAYQLYVEIDKLWLKQLREMKINKHIENQRFEMMSLINKNWGISPHDPKAEDPPSTMEFSGAVRCKTLNYHVYKSMHDKLGIPAQFPFKAELGVTRFIELTVDVMASDPIISKGVLAEVKRWRRYAKKSGSKRRKINKSYFDECINLYKERKKFRTLRDLAKSRLRTNPKAPNFKDRLMAEENRIGKSLAECQHLIDGGYRNITL